MPKAKLAIGLFILSEANFFLLLIIAYVYYHAYPGSGPTAASVLNPMRTGLFSILLFASSATMLVAANRYRARAYRATLTWLVATVALGAMFLLGQALEYAGLYERGVAVNRNLFATTFFTLTGFHGLHVFIGLVAIAIVAGLSASGRLAGSAREADAFEAVGIYWHFVDAVWVVIFSVVYLWAIL
ncbi:MAG TPA: cytochrome c oxidase subunit 3 [Candidatus Binataceae bacterium]|nr:cytochrome c oxidase subunit 3 [Candidatus Binataceae bacterium]